MVFCGLFPIDSDDYPDLRDALEKLVLNDAALSLGAGDLGRARASASAAAFWACCTWTSCEERLEREYDLELLATMPSVRVRRDADQRRGARGAQPLGHARPGHDRADPRAVHHAPRSSPRKSSSAR